MMQVWREVSEHCATVQLVYFYRKQYMDTTWPILICSLLHLNVITEVES